MDNILLALPPKCKTGGVPAIVVGIQRRCHNNANLSVIGESNPTLFTGIHNGDTFSSLEAVSHSGRFAAIVLLSRVFQPLKRPVSNIVSKFVNSNKGCQDFIKELVAEREQYPPFCIIVADRTVAVAYNSVFTDIYVLRTGGVYSISSEYGISSAKMYSLEQNFCEIISGWITLSPPDRDNARLEMENTVRMSMERFAFPITLDGMADSPGAFSEAFSLISLIGPKGLYSHDRWDQSKGFWTRNVLSFGDHQPNKPIKGYVSAFNFFSKYIREYLKITKTQVPGQELNLSISKLWKNLTPDEIFPLDRLAEADKKRFLSAAQHSSSSRHANVKLKVRDPKSLRRKRMRTSNAQKFMSAYILFVKDRRKKIQRENPHADFCKIGKLLGQKWRNLSSAEKHKFEVKSQQTKVRKKSKLVKYSGHSETKIQV